MYSRIMFKYFSNKKIEFAKKIKTKNKKKIKKDKP